MKKSMLSAVTTTLVVVAILFSGGCAQNGTMFGAFMAFSGLNNEKIRKSYHPECLTLERIEENPGFFDTFYFEGGVRVDAQLTHRRTVTVREAYLIKVSRIYSEPVGTAIEWNFYRIGGKLEPSGVLNLCEK